MSETDVNNPAYVVPPGHADAPPPVPKEATPDPQTQEYLDGFTKAPDPRDPPTSELAPGDLYPPTTNTPPAGDPVALLPVNVDVPYVSQDGAALNCTMGNWTGEPTAYTYQWQRDGLDVGDGTASHILTEADIGVAFVCIVTASNAMGSTIAPPSNSVTVEATTRSNHRGRGR
jgi:hypothetical protein